MKRFLSLIAVVAISQVRAAEFNWPHYRGPDYNGVSLETGLRDVPEPLWQAEVHTGFSGVTVVGDRVYTMGNSGDHDVVVCLDAATGKQVWAQSYACKINPHMYEGGPNATPTVADDRVYTFSKEGHAYCFGAADGKTLWVRQVHEDFQASPPEWGFSGSPTVLGKVVIYNAGDGGVALDCLTGEAVWQTSGGQAGYSTPVPLPHQGGQLVAIFTGKKLLALRPETGDHVWDFRWKTSYDVNAATPLLFGDRLFISSGYNTGGTLLDISDSSPRPRWREKGVRTHFNSAVFWGDSLFALDGDAGRRCALVCLDPTTGKDRWRQPDIGFGGLIAADGKLFVLTEKGELLVVEARADKYVERSRMQAMTGKCWTEPTICNGQLYLRNAAGHLACFKIN